jgi:hypothetical protein
VTGLGEMTCVRGLRVISPYSSPVFYNTCSYRATGFVQILLIAWTREEVFDIRRAAGKELFDSVL